MPENVKCCCNNDAAHQVVIRTIDEYLVLYEDLYGRPCI